jgi:DNA-directed RNA polymerase subunit RPC12/RpoP
MARYKMIELIFGNVGSGKTSTAVLYMKMNTHKIFITNIDVKGKEFSHVMKLKGSMIILKEQVSTKRDGTPVYKMRVNIDFWKKLVEEKGSVSVILDEAHILLNPRRSLSKTNVLVADWLSMLRRVIGSQDNSGELVLITQLVRRIDIIAREMAVKIQFVIHHYLSRCSMCGAQWWENNETADKFRYCPKCGDWRFKKVKSYIEVFCFKNVDNFMLYKDNRMKTYYKRYIIKDIESIFKNYNTLQWDDLLSEFY